MERLDTDTASVQTPERVWFKYRVAGPGQRSAALAIDGMLLLAIVASVGGILAGLAMLPGFRGLGAFGGAVLLFAAQWGYGLVAEWLGGGRSPGKWAVGLRVVREDGSPARFPDLVLRNLLRGVDLLPVGGAIGAITMWFDPRMRRIGDLAAGTVVISEEGTRVLGAVGIDPPVTDEERQEMPARIPLTREEQGLIEELLRRRRSLSAERVEELARYLGPALAERSGWRAATWTRTVTLAYARATGKDRDAPPPPAR